jgi:mRNA interferase MazF
MIPIQRTEENGLDADSAGNVLQIRSVASERFVKCLGKVSAAVIEELVACLIVCTN